MRVAAACALVPWLFACSIGEGSGEVKSDHLFLENCWDGPFDLNPNFFAANPFENTLMIRIQRGEQSVEVTDGVIIIVEDIKSIREQLGTSINLGLPVGVSPPGIPEQLNLNPPKVSLSLFLYNTCHLQNAALYSVGGSITFKSLFSGDPNESRAEDLLTEGSFEATVADPRDGMPTSASTTSPSTADAGGDAAATTDAANAPATDGTTGQLTLTYPQDRTSSVTGNFRFYFQRGIPAQPFP